MPPSPSFGEDRVAVREGVADARGPLGAGGPAGGPVRLPSVMSPGRRCRSRHQLLELRLRAQLADHGGERAGQRAHLAAARRGQRRVELRRARPRPRRPRAGGSAARGRAPAANESGIETSRMIPPIASRLSRMRWNAASSACFERATSSAAMGSPPPDWIGHERAQVALALEVAARWARTAGPSRTARPPRRASSETAAATAGPAQPAVLARFCRAGALVARSDVAEEGHLAVGDAGDLLRARSPSIAKDAAITPFSRISSPIPWTTGAEATSDSTRPARQLEDVGGGFRELGERLASPRSRRRSRGRPRRPPARSLRAISRPCASKKNTVLAPRLSAKSAPVSRNVSGVAPSSASSALVPGSSASERIWARLAAACESR